MSKVVVFLPSEIYCMKPQYEGQKPEFDDYPGQNGDPTYCYYSTCRLEAALAEGYEVFILDTVPENCEFAAWYRALVEPDHILSGNGFESMESGHVMDSMSVLYKKLGLPWDDTRNLWSSHMFALLNHGVKLGYQIKPLKSVA